jgi:lipid-binding SYLF domain-containing protein
MARFVIGAYKKQINQGIKDIKEMAPHSALDFSMKSAVTKSHAILLDITKKGKGKEKQKEHDKMISILRSALGIVLMTTIKASGCGGVGGGTGILVTRKRDGTWSAPLAVGGMSLTMGSSLGVAVTDSLIIFMDRAELQHFTGIRQNIKIGVAAGGTVGSKSQNVKMNIVDMQSCYTFTSSFGLQVGAGVSASFLTLQPGINYGFYGRNLKIRSLLNGEVERPPGKFDEFYASLESLTGTEPSPIFPDEGLFPGSNGNNAPTADNPLQAEEEVTVVQQPLQNEVVQVVQQPLQNEVVQQPVVATASEPRNLQQQKKSGGMFSLFRKKEPEYESNRQIILEWESKSKHPTYELTVCDSKGEHQRRGLRFKIFRTLSKALGNLPYDACPFPPTYQKSSFGMMLSDKELEGRKRMLKAWLGELEANACLLSKKKRKVYEKFLYGRDGRG